MPNIQRCSLRSRSSTPTTSVAARVKLAVEFPDHATRHFKFVVDPGEMLVNAVDPPVNAIHASANAAETSVNSVESTVNFVETTVDLAEASLNLCAGKDLNAFFLADHAGTIALPQSSLSENRPLCRSPFRTAPLRRGAPLLAAGGVGTESRAQDNRRPNPPVRLRGQPPCIGGRFGRRRREAPEESATAR